MFGNSYCNAGTWEDPDESSSYCDSTCDRTSGDDGIAYNIGGETTSGDCCGNNNNEYVITEQGGTDAPGGFGNGITTCCDPGTDCTFNDNCVARGDIRANNNNRYAWCCHTNEESCSANTWYGGDAYLSACIDIVGSGFWNIGFETGTNGNCCGDDSSEYKRTCVDSSAEGNCGSDTEECCTANNKCVDQNGGCRNSGSCHGSTAFGNSYCNAGTWEDPDESSSYCVSSCDLTSGDDGIAYNIDGETTSGDCCGNNNNEYVITEQSGGTDSPSGYNDGITTCCNPGTDCTHDDTCTAAGDDDGSAWCCSTGEESCSANTWYGPDDYQSACNDLVGLNRWSLGGELAATTCCGDDSNEYSITCQDGLGGSGACADSTDDFACCNANTDCVYNNFCYSDQDLTPDSNWICLSGTWIRLGITVVINATPTTATTVWQNTSATASVYCTTPAASIQCDANSYRLHISTTSISTCPTDYNNDYSPPGTQTVSSHSWVCGAAKDTLNNEGFSDPVEFLVDQIAPTASLNPLPTWTNQSSVTVDWSGSDTGGSGIWRFDLHYRITDIYGSVIQGWTWWANPTSNPGSRTFLNMTNNRTYQFRIRARDNAGNIGGWSASESISVDLVDPTCQMANLPMYTTSSSFVVSWSGSDGESGIQYY
ncbi:MAG: fibronectin type III domain-containing protein, partial [Candidatus Aenigmatarchaeota archaeon]